MDKKWVLVGSLKCQEPEILEAFLKSLINWIKIPIASPKNVLKTTFVLVRENLGY